MKISSKFPKYTKYDPKVPVWCVTSNTKGCIQRFFDTSPFSPSGKYLAVFGLPQESERPKPGEKGKIIVINLETAEEKVVYETCGWEPQMGANINWGATDQDLFFNDVDTKKWEPVLIHLNPITGKHTRLEGSIYRISPDGKTAISANMTTMRRTQFGYGVVIPDELVPANKGFAKDDGLYKTDIATGKKEMIVSIAEIFDKAQPKIDKKSYENGECYGFHCKYNLQGDKIIFTLRWYENEAKAGKVNAAFDLPKKGLVKFWVLTMNPDGSDVYVAVGPEQWSKGGHHNNWYPDGRRISMNLCLDRDKGDDTLYLVEAGYDGSYIKKIIHDIPGSGHPTVHPNGRNILTDAYEGEPVSFGDGTVPLRWIDLKKHEEITVVRINVGNDAAKNDTSFRVDPHPSWDNTDTWVAFNGFEDGSRRVYVSDFSELL